jgi:negative regulator of flagellin synthesis FlgM
MEQEVIMKVSHYHNPRIDEAHPQSPLATQQKTETLKARQPKRDEIILSPRAVEVRKFGELATTIPDVRQDKVEAVKEQIESGTYDVPGKTVARSITKGRMEYILMSDRSFRLWRRRCYRS